MDAAKKFWTLPELGEKMISLLDPLSTLRLIQSNVMAKDIMQKSLTYRAWRELIERSSLQAWEFESFQKKLEDVQILVKILHFMKSEDLSPLLVPLLDLICESSPGCSTEVICPCGPKPHSISFEGFQLLEEVEGAFGTTEQSLKAIYGNMGPIASRISRQKETVASVYITEVTIKDKSSVEELITVLQAKSVSVAILDVRGAEFGAEVWQALAAGLRGKSEVFDWIRISRQDLKPGVMDSIRAIWAATKHFFKVFSTNGSLYVEKYCFVGEQVWRRLKQIADMTDDEFAAECKQLREEDSDQATQSEGGDGEEEDEDQVEEEGEEEDS